MEQFFLNKNLRPKHIHPHDIILAIDERRVAHFVKFTNQDIRDNDYKDFIEEDLEHATFNDLKPGLYYFKMWITTSHDPMNGDYDCECEYDMKRPIYIIEDIG